MEYARSLGIYEFLIACGWREPESPHSTAYQERMAKPREAPPSDLEAMRMRSQ